MKITRFYKQNTQSCKIFRILYHVFIAPVTTATALFINNNNINFIANVSVKTTVLVTI